MVWASYRKLALFGAAGLVAAGFATPAQSLAAGEPSEPPKRELLVAHDVMRNERIPTGNSSEVQLLFPDQSSLTIARGSDVVINEFAYDPKTGSGQLAATVTRGVLRYVGGAIAKKHAVSFASPAAVVSLQGGIVLIRVEGEAPAGGGSLTEAVFLSGDRMCLAANGASTCTARFDTAITGRQGGPLSAPAPVGAEAIEALFGRLHGSRDVGRHGYREKGLG